MLAVIAPTVDFTDHPADTGAAPLTTVESPGFDPTVTLNKRPERASRGIVRRAGPIRPAARRGALKAAPAQVKRVVRRKSPTRVRDSESRTESRSVVRRSAPKHTGVERRIKRVARREIGAARPGMSAVIAYARSQLGKRYGAGGEGPGFFDCSGLTKSAYARAGIRLPHSSGAQAARARGVSRAAARPGDLVVGPGHVGVYMGGGMMIDAGNSRTGVVFRKLYRGLRVERL